ncbi:hypothetical protein ACHHV8_26640 [Paenibacillus sp. TAB 01]|uniref:hypothetical protein n=1 Tax=Paenibacillus sp. TAB 01 TaxID=3368988 RepID=UPI003752A171
MPHEHDQLCPWCQTEIVWDPEIGPEDTCPHCFNELGQYRSIQLQVRPTGEEVTYEELDDYEEDYEEDEDFDVMDDYEEGVQRVLDTQEEAPECSACQSLMLLAGHQKALPGFEPNAPKPLKKPLLKTDYAVKVYVCPSCYKVEQVLSEQDRSGLIELLKQHGGQ